MDANDRRKRAAAEAAEWWVVLQQEASRMQRQRYVEWLRESVVHVVEMLRVAQVHGALSQFERWARVATDPSARCASEGVVVHLVSGDPDGGVPRRPSRRPRTFGILGPLAAALLITAGVGWWWFSGNGQVIETERGERREVALADGSVVQVDPETRLRVKYEARARTVFLDRGRALFHVAKNRVRPFLVDVHETTVRAVGTAFAVERGTRSIVVTVEEGQVAIFPKYPTSVETLGRREESRTQPADASRVAGSSAALLLSANQQVTVDRSGAARAVHAVDSGQALAWADGKLIFKQVPVAEVIRQFNRYNRIQLMVNDPTLAGQMINGVFNAAEPESFVAFLQTVAAVKVTRNDAGDVTIGAQQ